ncbi:OstA-like protein [Salinimicrobium terrae]|uniref:OstA-like protein n=1 Tax=Salinimicrobium terrae TaxID=470866 RepID=UPI0006854ED3
MYFYCLFAALFLGGSISYGQEDRKIRYESERTLKDEQRYPGAFILSKVNEQVHFIHQGIEVWADQAIHYAEENFFKAYGNVRMEQGDTITMTSQYAEYNGNTRFAFASGNVFMRNPQTSLQTDTLFFDREKQQAYYRSGGTIRDTASVLQSRIGRYYLEDEKYTFASEVVITNPDYVLTSDHLDFYSESGDAYFYGPTTIESDQSTIYAERGYYDTRGDTGYFVKNSRIDYENRLLEGDSLYFNRNTNFASATNNIVVTDTINESIIRGHYAEVFRDRDSVFITKRALAVSMQEQDSIYLHADTLMVTGKPDDRVIRGFYDVRMFKSNMSGKSDSIHVRERTGLTQMLGRPVIWSENNQLTGDTIHLMTNVETEKMDSLKVYDNAFMIQRDSLGGYNQLKGLQMYGKIEDNKLKQVDLVKNTETLYFMRNDPGDLIGINKTLSSSIIVFFEDGKIEMVDYINNVDGILYPESDLPEEDRTLKGFNWRGEERPNSVEDLFADDPDYVPVRIEGIPLPEEEESFFDNGTRTGPLLNEKSRLQEEDLQETPSDTIPGAREGAAQPEPLLRQEELDSLPAQDSKQPIQKQQQDTISPAVAIQPKKD